MYIIYAIISTIVSEKKIRTREETSIGRGLTLEISLQMDHDREMFNMSNMSNLRSTTEMMSKQDMRTHLVVSI